jgi:dihydroneopterin aldolase
VEGDRIEVRGLRVFGAHGVAESELDSPQPFEIDLDILLDTEKAAHSDDLADTVDYAGACALAAAVIAGPPHRLMESLAGRIAAAILGDPRVLSVTVGLRKLRPPLSYDLDSAGVRVTRSRPGR